MTKADVQYLEYRAISEAKKADKFVLNENKQTPKAPNLPEYQKDSMDEFLRTSSSWHRSAVALSSK